MFSAIFKGHNQYTSTDRSSPKGLDERQKKVSKALESLDEIEANIKKYDEGIA